MQDNQKEAVAWAKEIMDQEFIILDTETNGWGNDFQSQIIQVGIINKHGDVLMNAMIEADEVQQQATDIHGITLEALKCAPEFRFIWPAIQDIIWRSESVVAYNADFDYAKLLEQSQRESLENWALIQSTWHCAMKAYAKWYGQWNGYRRDWKWQKLDTAVKDFHINIPRAMHDATLDVRLTLEVIKAMAAADKRPQMKLM